MGRATFLGAFYNLIWDRCYDFLEIFAENIGVFAQNKAKLLKNWIVTLVFEKPPFFRRNWKKSQKIVMITLTPGHPVSE
jgi:hypothetical protein